MCKIETDVNARSVVTSGTKYCKNHDGAGLLSIPRNGDATVRVAIDVESDLSGGSVSLAKVYVCVGMKRMNSNRFGTRRGM